MGKILYHYSDNDGCFAILKSHQIRMSDIRKSNDNNEMLLMYPHIMDEILYQYRENQFPFKYEGKTDFDAICALVFSTEELITDSLVSGDCSNFVACFSEKADLLSQWRGYANDGKGCCLGFSLEQLEKYCSNSNDAVQLKKVKYIRPGQQKEMLEKEASDILLKLKDLRAFVVSENTFDDDCKATDSFLQFYFREMIQSLIIDSLCYKKYGFSEEKEWRVFLTHRTHKTPGLILGEHKELPAFGGFSVTVNFLQNKIGFSIREDNISPFVPLSFDEFESMPVTEIWTGPKSKISDADLKLFLTQMGYPSVKIKHSSISYR